MHFKYCAHLFCTLLTFNQLTFKQPQFKAIWSWPLVDNNSNRAKNSHQNLINKQKTREWLLSSLLRYNRNFFEKYDKLIYTDVNGNFTTGKVDLRFVNINYFVIVSKKVKIILFLQNTN